MGQRDDSVTSSMSSAGATDAASAARDTGQLVSEIAATRRNLALLIETLEDRLSPPSLMSDASRALTKRVKAGARRMVARTSDNVQLMATRAWRALTTDRRARPRESRQLARAGDDAVTPMTLGALAMIAGMLLGWRLQNRPPRDRAVASFLGTPDEADSQSRVHL
jgi:hypothetical protein